MNINKNSKSERNEMSEFNATRVNTVATLLASMSRAEQQAVFLTFDVTELEQLSIAMDKAQVHHMILSERHVQNELLQIEEVLSEITLDDEGLQLASDHQRRLRLQMWCFSEHIRNLSDKIAEGEFAKPNAGFSNMVTQDEKDSLTMLMSMNADPAKTD